jgi:undecaprenyl-diphosphatase
MGIPFPQDVDNSVLTWFQAEHAAWLNPVVVNLTDLGHRYVVMSVAVLAILCFLVLRQVRTAVVILAATVAAWVLIEGIKRVAERQRPPKSEVQRVEPSLLTQVLPKTTPAERNYSFPSGHALSATAVYLTLALVIARRLRRRSARVLLIAGTAVLLFLIGISRLYLGAHYMSDVLAGWILGLVVALAAGWLDWYWSIPRPPPPPPIGPLLQ